MDWELVLLLEEKSRPVQRLPRVQVTIGMMDLGMALLFLSGMSGRVSHLWGGDEGVVSA